MTRRIVIKIIVAIGFTRRAARLTVAFSFVFVPLFVSTALKEDWNVFARAAVFALLALYLFVLFWMAISPKWAQELSDAEKAGQSLFDSPKEARIYGIVGKASEINAAIGIHLGLCAIIFAVMSCIYTDQWPSEVMGLFFAWTFLGAFPVACFMRYLFGER